MANEDVQKTLEELSRNLQETKPGLKKPNASPMSATGYGTFRRIT
jgi:hypothetical protein